jgi:hypothetical protein
LTLEPFATSMSRNFELNLGFFEGSLRLSCEKKKR